MVESNGILVREELDDPASTVLISTSATVASNISYEPTSNGPQTTVDSTSDVVASNKKDLTDSNVL